MAYARNIDTWDPMSESYHDQNINSYENGPGANLTPYARSPPNQEHKLYVNQIPPELSEEGIQQVFNRYGNTTSVMSPPGTGWAFVTYSSFREAETAMRELNHKPPLNLYIAFAKKKETDSKKKKPMQYKVTNDNETIPGLDHQRREYISPEQRPLYVRPIVRNSGRGKELSALARRMNVPPPEHLYHENDDLLYPAIHDPNLYDPYEDAEPYAETNNLWARGRLQISNDGTRFVTMGRGSTWYELPPPHPRVHQQIRAVYENREAGLYEYGTNKLASQIGKCQHCAQTATMRCQRCREFYCSRACQETDWPRHKIECQAMPPLEGGADSASLSISSGEEVPHQAPIKRSIRKLRRPLRDAASTGPNSASTPVPSGSTTAMPAMIPEATEKSEMKENEPLTGQSNFKRNHSGDEKQRSDENKALNSGGWNPKKSSDFQPLRTANRQNEGPNLMQRLNSSNGLPPPLAKQENVIKQESSKTSSQGSLDNKRCVRTQNPLASPSQTIETQRAGDQGNKNYFKRGNTQEKSHQQQRNYQQMNDQVKDLKINQTENEKPACKPLLPDPDVSFHRASETVIVSAARSPPKVSFQVSKDHAVAGTSGIQSTPNSIVNDMSKRPPVQTEDKTKTISSPPVAATSSLEAKIKLKNIVELLDVDEQAALEAHVLLGGNKAAVTVCSFKFQDEYAMICEELKPECEKTPKPSLFKPKVGDFVCGKRLDDWIRGTVASLGPPMRLEAADEGRVEPVTDLKPVPQKFSKLPTLGAICELVEGDFKLEAEAQYTFMVLKKNPESAAKDGIEIILYSADEKGGKALLRPWTPAPEQKGLPYASLQSGTEVCIASFRSHILIFVQSQVTDQLQMLSRLTQDVALWSTKASKLTEPPVIGEMVIAKYAMDGNFYRAIVRKIVDSKITVSYVDYGDIDTTTLDNIRPISPKLKEYPSCTAKVVLKDVPKDVPMTKEVYEYLAILAGMKKPLMCTFTGCPSTDGVILKAADDTITVNNKVVELLTPSWKKEEDKTTVFTVDDLDVVELGVVGSTLNVLTLSSYEPLAHSMAPQDSELIEHITGVMTPQIEEYCKQLHENYIPRQSELCLAPYDGSWYRAVCLVPNTSETTSTVNFIDFGNIEEIPHSDLRLITKDFLAAKALASLCHVVGLGPVDKDGNLPAAVGARVTELVEPNNITLIKILKCIKPGEYEIELPEVKEILIKEGLLKM